MFNSILRALSSLLAFVVLAGALTAQEVGHPNQAHEHTAPAEGHVHALPHDFSDAEHWSRMFDSEDRQEWQKPDEVVALMQIEPGATAVDLGAGTGYFLGYLSSAVGEDGHVLALDVEENLVRFMQERVEREGWKNVEPRRIPYDDPELGDGTVDRVLIVNTWHHIGERPTYAAKLYRALKPGGRVVVVDLTKDSPTGPPPEHRLEPEQIIEELEAGGLEAELVDETLPRQFLVVGRR